VPIVDGALDEWSGRAIELNDSRDGITVDGAVPQAYVGYDGDALYVAMRMPVRDPKALRTAHYLWGDSDGVEVAFRRAEGATQGPTLSLRGWPDGHFRAPALAGVPEAMRSRLAKAVRYRASVGKDAWTCEWRIPLLILGEGVPSLLNVNLAACSAADDAWRIWRMDSGATYDLRNGGTVILGAQESLLPSGLRERLAVWLDAAEAATVERDASGGVSVWKDRSGKGRDAVQREARFRPLYQAEGLDGKPALAFDEKRQTRLLVPDLSDQPMTVTVFAVFSNREPGLPQNSNPRIFTASNGKAYDYLCGISCNIPGSQTGGPRLVSFEGKDRWAKQVRVGCFSPNLQTFLTGQVSEILVFDRKLTAEERFLVTAYLTGKWEL
jgi:hypothetical protein